MRHDLDTLHDHDGIASRWLVSSHPQLFFFRCDHREIPRRAKKTIEAPPSL